MKVIKKPFIFFGFIALLAAIVYAIKKLVKETDTKLISDKTLKALEDEKADDIRSEIKGFHKTHDWDKTRIQSFIQ